uniref:Uncharacterized protein n=1 Tax=Ascaris lumbricoides TaxID=6252 RepID=A0A0M3HG52_ASCLU
MMRRSRIDRQSDEKPRDHNENKHLRSSSSRALRLTSRGQRFGTRSEYLPQNGSKIGNDDHKYENLVKAMGDEVTTIASLHSNI